MTNNPKSALFQILRRNNDVNGNPYRLVMVYDVAGNLTEAYEARSSSPNICHTLRKRGLRELPMFHLGPAEYNATKRFMNPAAEN